jgi:hypothetical protein
VETISSSETLIVTRPTGRHIPEDGVLEELSPETYATEDISIGLFMSVRAHEHTHASIGDY